MYYMSIALKVGSVKALRLCLSIGVHLKTDITALKALWDTR